MRFRLLSFRYENFDLRAKDRERNLLSGILKRAGGNEITRRAGHIPLCIHLKSNQFLGAAKKRVLEGENGLDALINETATEDSYSVPMTFSRFSAFTRSALNEKTYVTKKGFLSLASKAMPEKNNGHSSFNEVRGV